MRILDKLKNKKQQMLKQIQRGRERTEQEHAEHLRRKINKVTKMKPGAERAIAEGLMGRKKTWDVMREEYERRKYEREKKYKK